jgi:hypothetical protein
MSAQVVVVERPADSLLVVEVNQPGLIQLPPKAAEVVIEPNAIFNSPVLAALVDGGNF